jgi:hypothetical protein
VDAAALVLKLLQRGLSSQEPTSDARRGTYGLDTVDIGGME